MLEAALDDVVIRSVAKDLVSRLNLQMQDVLRDKSLPQVFTQAA
jgi:hypothetical protein